MTPAAIAANRFGIGMRADASPETDPVASLRLQLAHFEPRPAALAELPSRAAAAAALAEVRMARRDARQAPDATADPARVQARREVRDLYIDCVGARVNAALVTPTPWLERLVHFWSNHFAMSVDKQPVLAYAGLFEFEFSFFELSLCGAHLFDLVFLRLPLGFHRR